MTARVALEKFQATADLQADVRRRAQLVTERLQDIGGLVPLARVKGRAMMHGLDVGPARRPLRSHGDASSAAWSSRPVATGTRCPRSSLP